YIYTLQKKEKKEKMNFNPPSLFRNSKYFQRDSQIFSKENSIQKQYDRKLVENYIFKRYQLHYDLLNYIIYLNYFIQILKIKQKNNPLIILNFTNNFISLTNEVKNLYSHLKSFFLPSNEIHIYYGIYVKADKEFGFVIEDLKKIWKTYNDDRKRSEEKHKFCNVCYHLNLELTKLRTKIQVNMNKIDVAGK